MKIKTSITISKEVLYSIDSLLGANGSRSEFIEEILNDFLCRMRKNSYKNNDLEILNRNANRLNKEAADVLSYQVEL